MWWGVTRAISSFKWTDIHYGTASAAAAAETHQNPGEEDEKEGSTPTLTEASN